MLIKALHSELLTELSGRFPSWNEYFVISEVRVERHFFVIFGKFGISKFPKFPNIRKKQFPKFPNFFRNFRTCLCYKLSDTHCTYGLVEDRIKKDEYGRIGFGPESSSSSSSARSAARAAASAARSKAISAARIGSLKCIEIESRLKTKFNKMIKNIC
jgi:hypothetical protein